MFLGQFLIGLCVLTGAIILNYLAGLIGLKTWYEFLLQKENSLSIDNYIFLFVFYPLSLGILATLAAKTLRNITQKN